MTDPKPVWQPSEDRIAETNMARFMDHVRLEYDADVENYAGLYRWSVENSEQFWPAVWAFCGIKASQPWDEVFLPGEHMMESRWFKGSRLNFAENLLRFRDDHTAIIFRDEQGHQRTLSYRELHEEVSRLAKGLKAAGVGVGDRVAGYMPHLPETIVGMLAATSIGAIWSSCSQDFGVSGLLDRFGQIEPKVLITADGYWYNGKEIHALPRVEEAMASLPSVEQVVVVPNLSDKPDISSLTNASLLSDFAAESGGEIEFEQLPFNHPIYILFSSGTTGKPKCIVHGAGGTLIQHLKELVLHTDLKREDRFFYFTTCGWMMWNWLVSGLAVGSTVVLYDGSPFHPGPASLLRLTEEEGITVFGASAKYFSALEKAGKEPARDHDMSSLKAILSTGSPLLPENYDYIYQRMNSDICLASISGGTDIVSCFVLGNPTLPVYRGEIQCRGLGMAVAVFDDDGKPVRNQKGELVCTQSFPAMPVYFWNDEDGRRYFNAYFDRFDNVWCHGDYAELTARDTMVIYGRSDAVLNPGGVRIGTAEIYRQVEKLDEVVESIAVGQNWKEDQRVILFVVLKERVELNDELAKRIRKTIRANATPRHVPAKILQVPEIPRTVSGKIVELAVQQVIHGDTVKNKSALANPDALVHFQNRPELERD
ncbi:acetoacetyl-CoA synthetase [Natronospira proteinivora]|uniref:Acetoacetyl-CoA synthetase n=1 Tax=Natronospira proteinivora TaxID=1807133 RepID=A0ABT1G866_9GAMM|nr:acetoacetate--CoA ligase [Natronospira proteinivora]MCP1727511.1 acetoacetyl-CoA synthetase [Natronospira proteinivora]